MFALEASVPSHGKTFLDRFYKNLGNAADAQSIPKLRIGHFSNSHDVLPHAPYFHNGSAAALMDMVNFYDTCFAIGMSAQPKNDLLAFPLAL